jgi:thymidylate synthase
LYQRSGDVGLGVPFNILSYAFLTHLIAHHCGLVAHKFCHFIGNAHVYDDHIDALRGQCNRNPYPFPTLQFAQEVRANIEDYTLDDFVVNDYMHHPAVKMDVRA